MFMHVLHLPTTAGYVQYDAGLFLAKNADSTHPDTIELFATSQYELVKGLFAEEAEALKEAQAGTECHVISYQAHCVESVFIWMLFVYVSVDC